MLIPHVFFFEPLLEIYDEDEDDGDDDDVSD